MVGIDRWGAEYASFSKRLCEDNACAEGVESRTSFALHDIFSKANYGDMLTFVRKLKEMGYEEVELIPTDNGRFMTMWEATWMALSGSAVLVGKK